MRTPRTCTAAGGHWAPAPPQGVFSFPMSCKWVVRCHHFGQSLICAPLTDTGLKSPRRAGSGGADREQLAVVGRGYPGPVREGSVCTHAPATDLQGALWAGRAQGGRVCAPGHLNAALTCTDHHWGHNLNTSGKWPLKLSHNS